MNRSKNQIIGLIIMLILVVVAQGCATVTKGTSQTVTVTTDPAGARCTLTREGAILAVMDPTPGSLVIKKNKKDVSVNCQLAEYKDTTGVFESKFADATMGNILLGGVIGAAIDASSGASHEYDPIVTLTMIPVRFASITDRDALFDKMRDDFIQGSEESMKLIAEKCKPQMCDYEKEEAEKAREARLAEIENERKIARIGDAGGLMSKDEHLASQQVKTSSANNITKPSLTKTSLINQGTSLEGMDALIIGTWEGEYYLSSPSWSREISFQFNAKDNQSYIGTGRSPTCKDIEAKIRHDTGNKYFITLTGCIHAWDGDGKLRYKNKKLYGKIGFRDGRYTFDVTKAK